ncbi:MAG: hypothetical protein LBJ70_02995 [Holosporales bacterium]|nr:hypothetical protein [Holosporales bacterium]
MDDPDPRVRQNAVLGLARNLEKLPGHVRGKVDGALADLLQKLNDPDRTVQRRTAFSLYSDRDALPAPMLDRVNSIVWKHREV